MAVHILFRPAAPAAAALVNAQTTQPQPPSPTMVRRSARLLQQPHIHHQGIMLNPVASSSSHTPPAAVITPKKTQHPVSRKRARPAEVNTSHTESESENELDSSHGKSSQRLRRPTATAASTQAPIIQNSQALKTTARSLRAQKRQRLSGGSDGGDEPLLGKSSLPLPSTPKAAAVPGPGHTTPTSTHASSPKLQTMAMSIPPPNATKTRAAKRKSLSGEPGTGAVLVQHENKAKATLDNDLCPPSLKKKRKTPETPTQDLHTMHVVKKSNGKGKEKAKEEGEEAITTSNELAAPRVVSLRPRRQQHTATALPGASKTKTTNKNTADRRKSGRPRPSASDNTPTSPAGDIQSRTEASTSNVASTSNETNSPPKPSTSTSNNTSSSSNTTNNNNNNTRNTPANPSILPISTTPVSSSNTTSASNPTLPPSPILSSPPSSPPTSPRSASTLPSHHAALTQPHAITQPHIHSPLTPLAHTTTTPPGSPPLGGGLGMGMGIGLGQRVSPPLDAVDLGPLLVSSSSTSTSNSGSASGSGSSSVKERERTSGHSSPRASPPPPPSPVMPLTPSSLLLTNAIGNSRSINNSTTSNSNNNTSPIALPTIPTSVFPPSFNEANVDASSHVSEDSIPSTLTSTTTTERSCSSSPILAPTITTTTDGTLLQSPPPPQPMDMPMGSMLGLELGLGLPLPLPLPLLPSISMTAGSSGAPPSYPGSSPGSVSVSASGSQESQLLNSGGEEHAPAPIAMPMLMQMHGLMGMNVGISGMGMGMGGGMQPSESEIGFGFQAGEYGGVFGASGNGSGDGTAGNGNGVVEQGMLHHSVDPMYGSGPSSGSSIGDGMEHQHQQHQQLHQEEGVMLMSRDDQLVHAQEQAQVHYELAQQQQQQAQQQQQRVGSPQPSLRLTLKQQKKLTYMPPTRLEDPPYIQKDTSLWATACKLRVWEMSKRYTPEVMRTVTAQYAHDYYTATGTFPLGYKKSASLRHPHHLGHHRRRSSGSAKGKERQTGDADAADPSLKRRRKGGAGGEEGAPEEDEDFMSEKYYPFELMDEDEDDEGAGREDGGAEGWGTEGAEMEDEGVYDDWDEEDEDDWDEDEDEDETDEDEEVEVAVSAAEAAMAASAASVPGSPAGSSTPTTPGTTPPIMTIVAEDGTVLSGDEDAEGEMEVDIEAFSDPSFNAELSSPTSPTTPAAPLSPDEGKVSVFYVPPPGAFQMQYGEAQAWDEVSHEDPQQQQMQQPMLVDQHQQQQESLDQEQHQHQHMQQHEQDQYQQHQHQQHQPPIQIQLTPANQNYMLSPVLSLPPPRLDSIRVGYLRHTELGAKLTGRGTPADRTRAAMWAKGWKVWVEEMEERRREEEAEQIMGRDSEEREGSRSPKRGAEDMEGAGDVGGEGEERGRARLRLEGLGDGLGDADLVVEVGRLSLPPSSSGAECGMLGNEHTHHESCEASRTEVQWDAYLCLEGKGPVSSGAGGHEAEVKLPSSASSLEMQLEHHLPRHHDIVSASDQNGRPPQPSVYTTPRPGQLSSTSSVSGSQSGSSLSLEGGAGGVDEGMFGLSMFDMGILEPNTWFASGGAADGGVGMGVGVDGVGVGGGDTQSVTASGTSTLSFALG